MMLLSIVGLLVFILLWGLAWRTRPVLAYGIFWGVVSVWVAGAIIQPTGLQHVPPWLPALPFAVVALTLFYFGALAWLWGGRRS